MTEGDAWSGSEYPDSAGPVGAGAPSGSADGEPAGPEGGNDPVGARPGGPQRRPGWARDVESLVQNLVAEVEVVQRRAALEAERVLTDARMEAESILTAARQEAGLIGDTMRRRKEERAAEVAALRSELQELARAVDATLGALEGVFKAMGPLVESVDGSGGEAGGAHPVPPGAAN